jgi:hypothetical protein
LKKQGELFEMEEMLHAGLASVERMSGLLKEEEMKEMQVIADNFKGLKR